MEGLKKILSEFPYSYKITLRWGEMDAAGHINNVSYLRWTETVRVEFFKELGINTQFAGDTTGLILAWQDIKYIFPMLYPDEAHITMQVLEINEDHFISEQRIFSKKLERIIAISKTKTTSYNYHALKKVPLTLEMKEKLRKFLK